MDNSGFNGQEAQGRHRRSAPAFLSKSRVLGTVMAFFGFAVIAEGVACAQCQYEVVGIIQAPSCPIVGPPNTFPAGMSSDGRVAGRYNICGTAWDEAFVWTPSPDGNGGTFKTLPRPQGVISARGTDVNSAGYVIGTHMFAAGGTRGFIYNPQTQEFKYLEALDPDITGGMISSLNAINDSNIAVGARLISPAGSPAVSNAVIWHPFGEDGEGREVVIDLGVMDGPSSMAEDGNSGDDAAGWSGSSVISTNARAWLWTDGDATYLGLLPGTIQSTARAVNDFLEVLGSCRTPEGPFVSFYWANGTMTQFVPPDGFSNAGPADINNLGQIVGGKLPIEGGPHHAYIWQNGQFYNLNGLTVNLPPNLHLTGGRVVTDNGLILAGGLLGSKALGAAMAPVNVPIADFNFDCKVDIHDLLFLLSEWGKPDSIADLNGDGTVGVADLLILLANWNP